MKTVYHSTSRKGSPTRSMSGALIVTALLFFALPLTQLISGFDPNKKAPVAIDQSLPPPPPPPPEPPPPEEEEEQEQEPELDETPPPLTLAQLDNAIDAGDGGVGNFGGVSFNFNAMDDLEIFDLADLDQIPQAISQVQPVFPYKLKRAGVKKGTVTVKFIVDNQGNTRSVRVLRSSNREFEQSAIEGVRAWRYSPGEKDGRQVATKVSIIIAFSLSD